MQDEDITQWLRAAKAGDREALDRALSVLYRELHVLAQRQLGGQKDGTLNTTGPVHETWLRLIGQTQASCEDRAHFSAYAASAMRSIVIDHTRQRLARKQVPHALAARVRVSTGMSFPNQAGQSDRSEI